MPASTVVRGLLDGGMEFSLSILIKRKVPGPREKSGLTNYAKATFSPFFLS